MKRLAATLATASLVLASITPIDALQAQAPAPAPEASTAPIAPPMLPIMTSYRYWPVQFVQFVGPELPYSMIELDVDPANAKHPLLYVTLTDRATSKRIHYASDEGLIASATAQGEEAHKTALAFEQADTENVGSISTLRFAMADGKPLEWRFVQGSDISEQGSGLTALAESKIPIFAYRELGALAGEGTALQVGTTVSVASVWSEYSHPPYFIPYHGAETESAHTLVFTPGQQTWTTISAPAALTAGATWELDGEHGNHRSIHIDKVDGPNLTVTSTDRFSPSVHCTLDVTRTGDIWAINRVRFSPIRDGEKHALTLQFTTPLTPTADHVEVSLLVGKKKTIATGLITAADTPDHAPALTFSTPTWLSGKKMTEVSTASSGTVTLTSHPL
jgi:hypothetical protein